ncbi:hypothetical protein BDFB_015096 [Asbolus verrucosus]|uniref:Uncharacterized protein n=1 Tax=Asbolus verrucosus TaxID=1661398 RepID=A0A482VT31_ASBVE|nr:hypothetical protein BDFB_015096 [Asbolus verrucosus]
MQASAFAKLQILLVLHDPVSIELLCVFVRLQSSEEDADLVVDDIQMLETIGIS